MEAVKREGKSRCELTVLGVEQVPAPSEKGLLTNVCDIIKRKFRPRQLFKDCESRLNNEVHVTEIGENSGTPKSIITKLKKNQAKFNENVNKTEKSILRRQLDKEMKREEKSRREPTVLGVETEQVPAPSKKGLLTDVRDTSIIKRKFRPRQLFKDCESRLNNEVHVTEIGENKNKTEKSILRRQLDKEMKTEVHEIRFGKTACPLFAEKINLSIDSDTSENNIDN